jgi:sodium transport system permease protein
VRWGIVRTIFAKELREALRDRRTLFAMFVLPVLIHPLMFLLLGNLSAAETQQRKTLEPEVAVWGPLPAAAEQALSTEIGLKVIERRGAAPPDAEAEARKLVDGKRVELVLLVPADASDRVAAGGGVELKVFYDSVASRSDGAESRLKKALQKWNEAELERRMAQRGLPGGFDKPLKLEPKDLASKRQRGADLMGRMLPFVMLFVMLTCGFLPAVDLTAGEKERGTLQTLLTAPVRPVEIVAGKYLTVVLISVIGATANLVAMTFALSRFAAIAEELELGFHLGAAVGVFFTMLPAALFLSALLLAMAVFARSFREAQSYLTPIMLVVLMPAMTTFMPGVELDASTALVPIANMALLARKLLAGQASLELGFVVTTANLAYAAAAILLTARVFETEQVLLSGEKPWRDLFGRRGHVEVTPSPRAAIMFVVVLLVLVYYGSLWADPRRVGLLGVLAITQLGLMLAPSLVWTAAAKLDFRQTFSLRWPSARGWAGALLLAAGGWAIGGVTGQLLAHFFAGARAYSDSLKELFAAQGVPVMVAIALFPAIAEEAAFRGFVLSGLANSGSRTVAVLGSAFAFGLMHLNPYHVIAATVLGCVIGFATLESGSILVGALFHLVNNGLGMLAVRSSRIEHLLESKSALAAGCLVALAGLVLLRGSRRSARG